jgi:N-acetyl-1-D-myo-inositol-2-amino-2-deoxy-alpha-D-glucopyranoside deacetylase
MAAARRLLLVHAHPDDEVLGTGATIARYVAEGTAVTLVTCTLGEAGEIHVPELAQLAADRADQLGGYRIGEWRAATAALGLTDARFLGGAGHYRDSGTADTPANKHPRAFANADLDTAAGLLVTILRETRPQVLVTYDPNGLYGHPDHIKAHRVAMRAVELAADPATGAPWRVAKVYWTGTPHSVLTADFEKVRASGGNTFGGVRRVEDLPYGTPDDQIAARIDGSAYRAAKAAGIRAYPSQIPADSLLALLARHGGKHLKCVEYYRLAIGDRGPGDGRHGWESDLFAGLDGDQADERA